MKIIGLTGGIGSGKSTAARYLITKGFAHIDADAIGRELTETGSPMLDVLNSTFGPDGEMGTGEDILEADGSLKRGIMASIVFADQAKIERLNSIMFQAIIARIKEMIESYSNFDADCEPSYCQGQDSQTPDHAPEQCEIRAILIDAPLLFESGLDELCDCTILITADMDTRIERVCERDQVRREEVEARIRRQMSDEQKRSLADFIIDNSGGREELYLQLDKLLPQIFDLSC